MPCHGAPRARATNEAAARPTRPPASVASQQSAPRAAPLLRRRGSGGAAARDRLPLQLHGQRGRQVRRGRLRAFLDHLGLQQLRHRRHAGVDGDAGGARLGESRLHGVPLGVAEAAAHGGDVGALALVLEVKGAAGEHEADRLRAGGRGRVRLHLREAAADGALDGGHALGVGDARGARELGRHVGRLAARVVEQGAGGAVDVDVQGEERGRALRRLARLRVRGRRGGGRRLLLAQLALDGAGEGRHRVVAKAVGARKGRRRAVRRVAVAHVQGHQARLAHVDLHRDHDGALGRLRRRRRRRLRPLDVRPSQQQKGEGRGVEEADRGVGQRR
mmetsp:Transcript_90445/g.251667  ORF Transcript_90445/g.251667 Transcript_90445/m.251667 type:complete len:332 (+) Transcript_90445:602-1597(+)